MRVQAFECVLSVFLQGPSGIFCPRCTYNSTSALGRGERGLAASSTTQTEFWQQVASRDEWCTGHLCLSNCRLIFCNEQGNCKPRHKGITLDKAHSWHMCGRGLQVTG